jgi:hypothetical protein
MTTPILSKLAAAIALGSTVLVGTALLGGATSSASTPRGGSIHFYTTPGGPTNPILVTGAIGDYGKGTGIDKNGKPDPNGTYEAVKLQKGTFRVDASVLDAKLQKAVPTVDLATCSGWFSATGPVTFFDGTGRYKGIGGKVTATATFAFVMPRHTGGKDKGQCNQSARSLDTYTSLNGPGRVRFA